MSPDLYRGDNTEPYSKMGASIVPFYRPFPYLFAQFTRGNFSKLNVLDYGAGRGRLERLARLMGVDHLTEVDTSPTMLSASRKIRSARAVVGDTLPFPDASYDVVLSFATWVDIHNPDELVNYCKEAGRVLKPGGVMIAGTATPRSYQIETKSFNSDFPENQNLKSGSWAKVVVKPFTKPVYDSVWSDEDHKRVIKAANFKLVETVEIFEGRDPIWLIYVAVKGELDLIAERQALFRSARDLS